MYYRLGLPQELLRFFAFPFIRASDLIAALAEMGVVAAEKPNPQDFVCLRVLAMGWNWACYLAQATLMDVLGGEHRHT